MKKVFLLLMTVCLLYTFSIAQNVGIGTTTPNANAALDISSTDKGLLVPRVTTAKRILIGNIQGMLVYDTNDNAYWYNNGTNWNRISVLPQGLTNGDLLYWNGTAWAILPSGIKGQVLRVCDGGITWSACTPIVVTSSATNITSTGATSGGLITNDGGATVTAAGVCYATTPLPTTANSFTTNVPVAGAFVSPIAGLTPNTLYYVRSYATNSQGTSYGNQDIFTTLSNNPITLTSSPLLLNFDGTNPPLPTGVTIRTGATVSALGTEALYNNANNYHWATVSAGARSYASGTLPSTTDSAAQSLATNRSIGYRQTGASGDPGTAFVFKIANTTGKTNFNLSFLLQSLDAASARTTTWTVDYGLGDTPASFTPATPVGTVTTGTSTFASNTVTVNFGTALNNQSQTVWIRIVALTASTGSGSRPTTAVDNFTLSWN